MLLSKLRPYRVPRSFKCPSACYTSSPRLKMSLPEWDAAEYDALRPSYGPETFERIKRYRNSRPTQSILELGCGTGQLTHDLASLCDRLVAMEPSTEMITQARKSLSETKTRSGAAVEFHQAGANQLDFIDDASVDLITAATAAHWFPADWWIGAKRVLKVGGTVALFAPTSQPVSTANQPLSEEPDNIKEINNTVNFIRRDHTFGARPGNLVAAGGYKDLILPQEPGWSPVERQEWLYVQQDHTITFEQLWKLLLTTSHVREWVLNHPNAQDPGSSPLEQSRIKIEKHWPKDGRPVYTSVPLAMVLLEKRF